MFSETVNNGKENKPLRGLKHCHVTLDIKVQCISWKQHSFYLHQKSPLGSSYPSQLNQVHIFTNKFPKIQFISTKCTLLIGSVIAVVSIKDMFYGVGLCDSRHHVIKPKSFRCRMYHWCARSNIHANLNKLLASCVLLMSSRLLLFVWGGRWYSLTLSSAIQLQELPL